MSIRLPTLTAIGAASLVSVVALAQPLKCTPESPDVVCTEQGAVRGIAEERTLAFKGVPYAQPPVGSLRWKAPLPAANWEGVRDGGRYGAMCPQLIAGEVKGDEDCHYVNIWRPQVRQPQRPPRPQPGSTTRDQSLYLSRCRIQSRGRPFSSRPLGTRSR
jgi:Carboxylesterase family